MLPPITLHLQIIAEGSTHFATLTQGNGEQITAKITILQVLHTQVDQLLESMRGTTVNKATPGLPVNIQKLEAETIALLHNYIFENAIGEAIKKQLAALEQKQELMLVIYSPDAEIRNLPWEAGMAGFEDSRIGIVRTLEQSCAAFQVSLAFAPTAAPLKMLFVTALPENISERGKELQIEDEQRKLIEAVGDLEARGKQQPKMVIEFLDEASLEEIRAALGGRRHDILHVSGHGKFNDQVKKAVLHLENADGDHLETEGKVFAEALRGLDSLRLVVLSACETAVVDEDSGTVEAVAGVGVSAVIGMRFSVGDETAKVFTTLFYRHLADGATVSHAVAQARLELWKLDNEWKKVNPDKPRLGEWFTPVLYLNGAVGALVDSALPYQVPADFYPREVEGKRRIGSGFIGRKRQLIQLRKAFRAGKHVCITGMGGIGKTTLAEAFAERYENGSHHLIAWRGEVEIDAFSILSRIVHRYGGWHHSAELNTLRAVIENREMPFQVRLHYVIQKCLKDEKVILTFDNFESLQDQTSGENVRRLKSKELEAFLQYLIREAPRDCHLTFITRYAIAGLDPDIVEINLEKLSLAEQYRWLNFSDEFRNLTSQDRELIYERMDGLPRAYQFLESLTRNYRNFDWESLEQELGKVEARVFENLMLRKIYGMLNIDLKQVLLVASVFIMRTGIDVLEAVMNNVGVHASLESLRSWSLCYYDRENREFEIPALTRKWIDQQALLSEIEMKSIALGIGNFLLKKASLESKIQSMLYFDIAEEFSRMANVSFYLSEYYQLIGLYDNAIMVCWNVLEKVRDKSSLALANGHIGKIYSRIGNRSDALNYSEIALALCREIDDKRIESITLGIIGVIYSQFDEHELALDYIAQSIEICKTTGDIGSEGKNIGNLGTILLETGSYEAALHHFQLDLEISENSSDRIATAVSLNNIGSIQMKKGNYDLALSYFEKSLDLTAESGGSLDSISIALHNISEVHKKNEKHDLALKYLFLALGLRAKTGNIAGQSRIYRGIGEVYQELSDHQQAFAYFEQSLFLERKINNRAMEAATLAKMSDSQWELRNFDQCLFLLKDCLFIRQELEDYVEEITTIKKLARVSCKIADWMLALEYVKLGLSITQKLGDEEGRANILLTEGEILIAFEQFEKAFYPLFEAFQFFKKINSIEEKKCAGFLGMIVVKLGEAQVFEMVADVFKKNGLIKHENL